MIWTVLKKTKFELCMILKLIDMIKEESKIPRGDYNVRLPDFYRFTF